MQNQHDINQKLADMVASLALQEGFTASALDYVHFMRSDHAYSRTPVMYEPCICIIVQGRKRAYLGDAMFVYDARQYLVVSAPMPFEADTEASSEQPMLGIHVGIQHALAAELALAVEEAQITAPANPASANAAAAFMYATQVDDTLAQAVLRLLQALASPLEAKILAPAIVREIYFRILMGEQGAAMRAALSQGSHFQKITRALRKIHDGFSDKLDVDSLARESGMSLPAFHLHFKQVTSTTPIQYIKAMRLHKARLLMIRSGMNAYTASNTVGYESSSQFSREFKRLFGRSPLEEVRQMRTALRMHEGAGLA
ncbi:AraC family transcriptional regulator [Undibacterium pigrum]|uniref:AraC-like DNA-binding protein n=1 Tax=Undibacterium pigrum TaxID=401470 RepID=A0A318J1G2_9BURK|nr:AraC family transcriptional regulator [Undibacterium pigrum]PXX37778.1 AraC-like DNA-binding protein [Undibacterium pigrum]